MFDLDLISNVIDVEVGDELLVDGGMVRFEVVEKIGPDVKCLCTDPGLLLPRASLALWRNGRLVQQRNSMLPTITSKVCCLSQSPSHPFIILNGRMGLNYYDVVCFCNLQGTIYCEF